MITTEVHCSALAKIRIGLALLTAIGTFLAMSIRAQSANPPHDSTQSVLCISCHMTPHSAVGSISNAVGNVNLCHSCHTPGGRASRYALVDSDQAITGPCLPTNVAASGTSHRWDSGLAGHADYVSGARSNASGIVLPAGDYTGRVAKTYVLTIVTNGQAGVAKFDWYGTQPGGGGASNVPSGSLVALDQGISVVFSNGTVNPSFRAGDRWNLYVRSDISQPTNSLLIGVISNGLLACSTCHDQHSQTNTPFDVNAPGTPGASGRHFQRIDNDADQLCVACHAARDVTSAARGSHPVGVLIPTSGFFRNPTKLPLDRTNRVRCMTCHDIHNSGSSDGSLLRQANRNVLCTDCHTQTDTINAAHLTLSTNMLWPGGQYGSTYPAETDTNQCSMCNNCHQPHGWPISLNSNVDYTNLLVEAGAKLCFTCHDGSPASASNSVMNDFTNSTKVVRHPVLDTDPLRLSQPTRTVVCTDCHNPHQARIGRSVYTNTATATRGLVMGPLVGASGVAVSYAGLTNFIAPATNSYTFTNSAVFEYQICFKCHTSYWWGTNKPPIGISANGTVVTNVTDLAQDFSPMNMSGHPIITGLDNYTNSTPIGGKKGLLAAAMKPPWNINVGQQTMLCADCHNTDGSAAQGPHGSAQKFMLRMVFTGGTNTLSTAWPTGTSFGLSWCNNCHFDTATISGGHGAHQSAMTGCYQCHIVIPHGGKMSRLIGDRDNSMPARYAYNNTNTTMQIQSFTKRANNAYTSAGSCQAACDGKHSAAAGENW